MGLSPLIVVTKTHLSSNNHLIDSGDISVNMKIKLFKFTSVEDIFHSALQTVTVIGLPVPGLCTSVNG